MPPREVYFTRLEYGEFLYERFRTNLRNARNRILAKIDRAAEDAEALDHDRRIYPIEAVDANGRPRWGGSKAERKLRKDMGNGKHLTVNKAIVSGIRAIHLP